MAQPTIPSAELRLTYPLYGCEFDPQDANRLIVGGGGGPGRSGVGNKITLLDTSLPDDIKQRSEIELSSDEDSVTTLAAGQRRGKATLVYAGINSSAAEIQKGKNEHLRVFGVDQPSRANAATGPKIAELARTALFSSVDSRTYQRLLRISPVFDDSRQLGAVATGDATEPEIALFDVTPTTPKLLRAISLKKEALDLDIIQTGDDQWQLAYCDEHDLHLVDISNRSSTGPGAVYTMVNDANNVQPSFRFSRYLTPTFILAASNLPKGGGVVLHAFRLAKPGKPDRRAKLAEAKRLPRTVSRAVSFAVRNLSPRSSPSARQGETQFVVAVAGHDYSITLYTLEHKTSLDIDLLANLFPITTIKAVHMGPISGLAFSVYQAPKTTTMRQQHLKLASIGSIGNTCVVHTLPLRKAVEQTATARRAGPPRAPRYVVALKSHGPSMVGFMVFTAVLAVLLALFVQGFFEVKGLAPQYLGARRLTPSSWHEDWKDVTRPVAEGPASGGSLLADMVADAGGKKTVLVADPAGDGVQLASHDAEQHAGARDWEALPEAHRAAWKERLKAAGHWGEEMGETVLKSVLFGELAGMVGEAVVG